MIAIPGLVIAGGVLLHLGFLMMYWASSRNLTVANQLGVDYNAHVIEAILTHVAPALGWR